MNLYSPNYKKHGSVRLGFRAWFKNSRFWVTQAKEVLPPFSWENGLTDRFEILLGEDGGAPEALKAEEFQPMRMALPGHEFRGTFADALRAFTPC